MRSCFWIICALALVGCEGKDDEYESLTHVTRIVVSPDEFLGELSCGLPGGMVSYQATLFDVTEGLHRAFQLPSSPIVSCFSDVNFERVVQGHNYVATVVGFDRDDLRAQNPGSPILVDKAGTSVTPRWSTTCWGSDDAQERYGGGGQGPTPDLNGEFGGTDGLGAISYYRTAIIVRGCDELSANQPAAPTAISFDLKASMLGMNCGTGAGQMSEYSVQFLSDEVGAGGAGGDSAQDEIQYAACGENLISEDWPVGEFLDFEVIGYEGSAREARWITQCTAFTKVGVTVAARCNAFVKL